MSPSSLARHCWRSRPEPSRAPSPSSSRFTRLARGLRTGVLAAALVVATLVPAAVRADGDPASDYLLVRSVFLPFNSPKSPQAQELTEVVRRANQSGFRIRVALIAHPYDLGTAYALMGKPQLYARFLGEELSFVYHGRLLVAMPDGYGYTVRGGHPDPSAQRIVARLPAPGGQLSGLAGGASVAVQRLAAGNGVHVAIPSVHAKGGSSTGDRLKIAAVAAGCLLLAGTFVAYRRRRANVDRT
jgi:hypothetical protein